MMAIDFSYNPKPESSEGVDFSYPSAGIGDGVFDTKGQKKTKRSIGDVAGDIAVTAVKGAIGLPEAFVGLADIPTGGAVGKALEGIGYRPGDAKSYLDTMYSEAQQEANKKVQQADGFVDTVKTALQNPSTIATSIGESIPQMIGGAGLARGAIKAIPKLAPVIAGAFGEGLTQAGAAAESQRQSNEDGLLTGKQSTAALASGIGTGLLGAAGGKLAQRLGIGDVDTLLAGGSATKSTKGFARQFVESGISEGVFEELPQSVQEQMWQNYAADKPIMEGVGNQAAMGLLSGAVMGGVGGGYNAAIGSANTPEAQSEPLLALPSPTYTGTPSDQVLQAEVERQNAVDAATASADQLYAERDAYAAEQQRLQEQGVTLVTDPAPIQQRIDAMLGLDQGRLTPARRKSYEQELNAALNEQVGITHDENGIEKPLTMYDYMLSQQDAADKQKQLDAAGVVSPAGQASLDRMAQVADEEAAPAIDVPEIPVIGPLSAAANHAVKTGVTAQLQQQSAPLTASVELPAEDQRQQEIAANKTKFEQTRQAYAARKAAESAQSTQQPDPVALPGNNPQPAGNVAPVSAGSVVPAATPNIQGKAPSVASPAPNVQASSATLPADPVRAYPKGQASALAGRMTKQGVPTESYPHPTQAGMWALRIPESAPNQAINQEPIKNATPAVASSSAPESAEIKSQNQEPIKNVNPGIAPILRRDGQERSQEARPDLALDGQTNEEAAADFAKQQKAAENERKATEKADKERKEAELRKEVKARSEAAAGSFTLGGDAMDNLTGQQDIFSQSAPKASAADFVPAPDGSIDFGEITPEMAKEMKRQPGKIRLQRGIQNSDGTGNGLAHIESNHGKQILHAGFSSVEAFVSHVAKDFSQAWQAKGGQVLVAYREDKQHMMYVQLEPANDGDYYRVNSAFPVRQADYPEKHGFKKLWEGSEPASDATGGHPAFAGQSENTPGQTTPNAHGQSISSVAKQSDNSKPPKIEDFGEKLEGARKDYASAYADKAKAAESLDVAAEPLSKSWPEPDYQKLIDEGADKSVVAWIRASRDEVPTKPQKGWKLAGWVKQVETLREASAKLLSGEISADRLAAMLRDQKYANIASKVDGRADLYAQFGHAQSFKGISFEEHFFSLYSGENNVRKWIVSQKAKATAFSNWPQELGVGNTREEALAAFKSYLDKQAGQTADESDKAAVKFSIYSRRGSSVFIIGKKVGKNHIDLKTFPDVKAARAFLQDHHDELVKLLDKAKEIPAVRRTTNSPRVGDDHRNGADVTPEQFSETFGMRGVQFGNYIEGKRRQADLNEAYDALMDLAGVIDVPPKALSLNGSLGLAFGARGKGGKNAAAAHYEPGTIVINLTKANGAGSLAHEWFHAVDNYFSRQRNDPSGNITDKPYERGEGVRPEMVAAFKEVMKSINLTGMQERSKNLDGRRSKDYWSLGHEMAARAFESYTIAKLHDQNAANDYLANIVSEEGFDIEDGYPYPTAAEIPQVRAAFDHFFETVEARETDNGVELFNKSGSTKITTADKAVYGMASEGQSAQDILKFIASGSRSLFNRQLARALLATGINPSVTVGNGKGWKMTAGEGHKYAAAYNPKTDTIALFRPGEAERHMLHEAIHAATLKALAKRGLAATQMKALYDFVKKSGQLHGQYGMTDVDEFIAEAFTNPKFQQALKNVQAPKLTGLERKNAWNWFVRLVRNILGLQAGSHDALSQALEIGVEVMRENVRIGSSMADTVKLSQSAMKNTDANIRKGKQALAEAITGKTTIHRAMYRNGLGWVDFVWGSEGTVKPSGKTKGAMGLSHILEARMRKDGMSNSQAVNFLGDAVETVAEGKEFSRTEIFGSVRVGIEKGQTIVWLSKTAGSNAWIVTGYEKTPGGSKAGRATNTPTNAVASRTRNGDGAGGGSNIDDSGTRYNIIGDSGRKYDAGWEAPEMSKMDDVIHALQDKHVDTKRTVEAIVKTGKQLADESNPYLQEELFHGRSAKGVKDFTDLELRPLIAEMNARNVELADFEEYLWNRHAEERNAQISKINKDMPDGGSGINTADAKAYLAALTPEKKSACESLAKRVDAINKKSQQILVESGLEKAETIAAWNGAYTSYVPLHREDVATGFVGTGKGYSIRGSSSKRAVGSKKSVVDILANVAMQREHNIVRAEKNRVSNALLGAAVSNPNKDFWSVDTAPTERVVETRQGKDTVVERIVPGFKQQDNVVMTRINGEDHYVIFNERDPRAVRMAKSIKNLDADQLGRVLSAAGKATRYLAAINTQYNPIFGIINLIRDAQGSMLNLTTTPLAGQQKKIMGYTVDALRGIYADLRAHREGKVPASKWAQDWEEFQTVGGQTGYRDQFSNAEQRGEALMKDLQAMGHGQMRKAGSAIFDWLSDYNESMENAVRLAVYRSAKESGISKEKAASLAKNISVNFNRKGQVATQMGALYAFFNASVQGSARLAETLTGPAGKRIIYGGIMLGSMQAMLLAAAGYDDDEPPEFVRERSLILPIGDGKYLSLPMPLGFHVIPNIGRILTEFAMGGFKEPTKRIASLIGLFADTFNPIGGSGLSLQTIAPSVVDPLAALAENKDWTGKAIAKLDRDSLNPTPGYLRAKDTATTWSKAISYALNIVSGGTDFKAGLISPTPDQLDYLIGQATGGVGRETSKIEQTATSMLSGEDLPLYKIPLVGRFVGDTQGQSAEGGKFYAAITRINGHENEIKGMRENGRGNEIGEYLAEEPEAKLVILANKTERDIQALRKAKRQAVAAEQTERVKMIESQITERMRRFNERVLAVSE